MQSTIRILLRKPFISVKLHHDWKTIDFCLLWTTMYVLNLH